MTGYNYNLLMLSGDNAIARGIDGAFYQMLARFSDYWRRIDILTPSAPDATARVIHDNVYVHPAPYHRLLQPRFIQQKATALFAERDYHLVTSHDFGFFYNGIGAWWLLRESDIPLVSEIHHIEGYPLATSLREHLWRQSAKAYIPFIAKRGAYFRVVNQTVAEDLQHDFNVPENCIRVLASLYLDLETYAPQPIEPLYDVLFVGRLAQNKGILLLLDAIAQLKTRFPTISLGIRGDGALKAQIEQVIAENMLTDNVTFLPRVADSDMPDLYRSARMLVCASTVEGNPRVTAEAMACGVPVISTRVGIMPELIDDGRNGFLVDWDSAKIALAIATVLENPQQAEAIARAGRASVLPYAAETTIRAYAEAYHAIIENHHTEKL
ncbi:MAG: glycosyltransferase family 4 protein [Chloroflexota bacterium]